MFEGPSGRYVDALEHLRVGDRIVFDFDGKVGTVMHLCIRDDGMHVGLYDGDDGSAGFFLVRDGLPRKQVPQTPVPTEEERAKNHAAYWRGRSLDDWIQEI